MHMQNQAATVGIFAIASMLVASVVDLNSSGFSPMLVAPMVFVALCFAWAIFCVRVVNSHGHRVLVRSWFSDSASLKEGSLLVVFPEYVVEDKNQFGPWAHRRLLPAVGQTIAIDVPDILVPVGQGLYCLKVNTKVIGTVEPYSVDELIKNTVSIEDRCQDVIANVLRSAVFDKPVEEALAEAQRIFLKDADSISKLLCALPAFKVTQLLLDADKCIAPADSATKQAFDLVLQRKQEGAKRDAVEAGMATEEQKVKLAKVALQASRNEMMLQQEIYGQEGAAMIEAAKHTKALYLFSGGSGLSSGGSGLSSAVLSLPS